MASGLLKKERLLERDPIGCSKDEDWVECTTEGRRIKRDGAGAEWWSVATTVSFEPLLPTVVVTSWSRQQLSFFFWGPTLPFSGHDAHPKVTLLPCKFCHI